MMDHYILVDGKPVLEPDFLAWARWYEAHDAERTMAYTNVSRSGDIVEGDAARHAVAFVSTVFLGLDHDHFGVSPILYETMVFANEPHISRVEGSPPMRFNRTAISASQRRYHTLDEALAGHQETLDLLCRHLRDRQPLLTSAGEVWPSRDGE